MIAIVNYGSGNIGAISNVYKKAKIEHAVVDRPEDLARAERFILPGVGHFDETMSYLRRSGLLEVLQENVVRGGKPLLGICVGMQILANNSEEGREPGLGWVPGCVRKFELTSDRPRIPHMGWNSVEVANDPSRLMTDVEMTTGFYFLHSYYFEPVDERHVVARAAYGGPPFACAVSNGANIFGVQFHPEKSHHNGRTLLTNFAKISPCSGRA